MEEWLWLQLSICPTQDACCLLPIMWGAHLMTWCINMVNAENMVQHQWCLGAWKKPFKAWNICKQQNTKPKVNIKVLEPTLLVPLIKGAHFQKIYLSSKCCECHILNIECVYIFFQQCNSSWIMDSLPW